MRGLESGKVGVVVVFASRGRAFVVQDLAFVRDVMPMAASVQAKTKVDVFAAVDIGGIEAADGVENGFFDDDTRGGDGAPARNAAGYFARPDTKVLAILKRHQRGGEKNAKVVVTARTGNFLHIADKTRVGAPSQSVEHWRQPAVGQFGVVIQQAQNVGASHSSGPIVVYREVALLLVEKDAIGRWKSAKEISGAISGAVVHDDNFVFDAGQRTLKRWQAEAGKIQAVINRHQDA